MAAANDQAPQAHEAEPGHYWNRAREFVELHDQVQTSVNLLDSLESFLSTFQKDLSAVSGQISELQTRSKDIDNKLKSRRRIEKPLSNLISDVTIPPLLATTILDSDVGEDWITTMGEFERRLENTRSRSRVKAARDLGEVAEGLRIVAATKLRAFFLALIQPIRSSVTTNMQVIQTSVLLKYGPLYAFLQRQAPGVAHEVQRSYISAARVYYETGFRRYARSLGWIKTRTVEKLEPITTPEADKTIRMNPKRLLHAKIEGPGVTLAFMADDKSYKEPIEALLRSLLLVFMDNATAEYTFLRAFFSVEPFMPSEDSKSSLLSPTGLLSPDRGSFTERRSSVGSDYGEPRGMPVQPNRSSSSSMISSKEERVTIDALWKQILDPVLEYCQTFVRSALDPVPPVTPLLVMIRLTESIVDEVQIRNCAAVETFVFGLRLQMWPVFQKAMTEHIESLKKLAEGFSSSYFSRAAPTTDAMVSSICERYVELFSAFIDLTNQGEETMIFSNLLRLRQELGKLILRHVNQTSDTVSRATRSSTIYEMLLQGLSKRAHLSAHPKSQQEVAYWAHLEEDARRKIISAKQSRSTR
ncbi:vacuolar sorting protein [Infundibulicybe gibba]|nr:vacuolar sorting protein [Infundibulicybe gibba]